MLQFVRANVLTRINAILGVLLLIALLAGSPIDALFGLVIIANSGPMMNSVLEEVSGMISSFMNNFNPSAMGCSKPNGPARLGPLLSCKNAATFRSAYVLYIATTRAVVTITAIRTNFSMIMNQSICSNIAMSC